MNHAAGTRHGYRTSPWTPRHGDSQYSIELTIWPTISLLYYLLIKSYNTIQQKLFFLHGGRIRACGRTCQQRVSHATPEMLVASAAYSERVWQPAYPQMCFTSLCAALGALSRNPIRHPWPNPLQKIEYDLRSFTVAVFEVRLNWYCALSEGMNNEAFHCFLKDPACSRSHIRSGELTQIFIHGDHADT